MHTYIIKNTNGFAIRLTTVGTDDEIRIDHGEMISMESDEELLSPVFQKLYRRGDIDYWHMQHSIKRYMSVDWKKEGF